MDTNSLKAKLNEFAKWKESYCKGYEKGEAQSFLDRFFQCFGYEGVNSAGAEFERLIKKGSQKGGSGFADCIFKDIVLIEMKKGGSDLTHHYNQLLTYWVQCTPKPKYAILCNFDEFWIYDFNIQVDTPVQKLKTSELAEHPEALLFMLGQRARFNLNVVEITETVTEQISELFKRLKTRQKSLAITEDQARRFVLQCVLCLFAEDIDLLPNGFFGEILHECKANPKKSYDLLRGLFEQMNSKEPARGGMYKDVRYFNGGLFNEIIPIQLAESDIDILITASSQNWTAVRPSIFGTVLEATMSNEDRHAHGVHYTSEVDIYKIVRPTIVRYWDERIEEALSNEKKKAKNLRTLWNDLRKYKILDPACGSGNFLYIAYQEMKRIEKEIIDRLAENEGQVLKSFVSPYQFYGIDIKPFAVELTKLVLEIGRTIAIRKLNLNQEDPLPLDNLDKNIICADALFSEWPEANVIIGNPPFLGGKRLRTELGDEYVEKMYKAFPEVKGQPDFCVHWFRKAHQSSAERVGLVGTNSISQGQSREATLSYVVENDGIIHDAVSTQEWSGEAAVHVSIANWIKPLSPALKPPIPTFPLKEEGAKIGAAYSPLTSGEGPGVRAIQCYLDDNPVKFINSSLKSEIDVTQAHRLEQNKSKSFEACQLAGKGFIVSEEKALDWIKQDKRNEQVLKIMIDGKGLIDPNQKLEWVIDFNDMSMEDASLFKLPFEHVKTYVKPERDTNNELSRKEKWWQFGRKRPEMRKAFQGLNLYFALPKVAKYTSFRAIDVSILPCEANMVVASDDYYILGILNSKLHRGWVKAQASSLKGDTRYTNTTCFETFPFLFLPPNPISQKPPIPTFPLKEEGAEIDTSSSPLALGEGAGVRAPNESGVRAINTVREIMKELDEFRLAMIKERNYGITKLYNEFFNEPASKLSKLHKSLDEAVLKVYSEFPLSRGLGGKDGWKYDPNKNYNEQLFALNKEIYDKETNN
jgi:SAM-dependent methyltransferase